MYTESIEKESKLLMDLFRSMDANMSNEESVFVRKCPKCGSGSIFTHCTHGLENKRRFCSFEHYCDTCDEQFDLSRISADIFFHKPFSTLDKIETPFGNITVKANGKTIPFRCRTEHYEYNKSKLITMNIIDIDLSELKQDDIVFCGFNNAILEYNDADERSLLYSCENDSLLLGLCAYDPYEWETDIHCFLLNSSENRGFEYAIITDPNKFDANKYYQSKIASIAVSWINKNDYDNPDLAIFLALTSFIG